MNASAIPNSLSRRGANVVLHPYSNAVANEADGPMVIDEEIFRPQVAWGYFPCASEGEDLIIYDPDDRSREIERFTFPRQNRGARRCISDFFRPLDSGARDIIGMSCVTIGPEASRRAAQRRGGGGTRASPDLEPREVVVPAEGPPGIWENRSLCTFWEISYRLWLRCLVVRFPKPEG